uniref:Putative secreted protein n=1 Tax=Anopheles darlingi TaxID=43151 RepID=A0A2M4D7F0_ANODA
MPLGPLVLCSCLVFPFLCFDRIFTGHSLRVRSACFGHINSAPFRFSAEISEPKQPKIMQNNKQRCCVSPP